MPTTPPPPCRSPRHRDDHPVTTLTNTAKTIGKSSDDIIGIHRDGQHEIAVSEYDGSDRDAALIQLDPDVGPPTGTIAGRYPVRGVLGADQIQIGMPLCKVGAVSGETCGEVTDLDGNMVEASVFSLHGDSGSPAFVKNADGTVSAVGILSSSPDGDDYTTYFALVGPILDQWGLHILS